MAKFYVTFGQKYRREEHPALGMVPALPDCWLTVEAPHYAEARALVVAAIGVHWSMMYTSDDWASDFFDGGEYARLDDDGLTVTTPTEPHKIQYGGTEQTGFWWRCKCGNAMGVPDAPSEDDRIPFEQAFDRTFWAHEHLSTLLSGCQPQGEQEPTQGELT